MVDIMTGLAAAGQALDIAKKLKELEKNFDSATFRLEIAELMTALADTKIALAEARATLSEKDAEIARLTAVVENKAPVVFYQGFNFGITPDGQSMGKPFCPACEKTKGTQIQIAELMDEHHQCPICQALYTNPPKLPASLLPPA